MRNPFDPRFEDLPTAIPIFPLSGALLLPRGRLPLNIFEPRYLSMTADALQAERVIGMVQPVDAEAGGGDVAVYPTGCAGRITEFSETDDGRYLITLTGLCRFEIVRELPLRKGYRRVVPHWNRYRDDLEDAVELSLDRVRLLHRLRGYLEAHGIDADWEGIEQISDDHLLTSLAMTCPFEPREKQALLECRTPTERGATMIALLEMAAADGESGDAVRH